MSDINTSSSDNNNNQLKMILNVGLPGSGKTTWTKNFIKSNPNYIRVNRDDIRDMISGHDYVFSREAENQVTDIQNDLLIKFMKEGKNIIVDDTNLNKSTVLKLHKLGRRYNYSVELNSFLGIDVDTCIERAAKRTERVVSADVIMNMYNKNLKGKKYYEFLNSLLVIKETVSPIVSKIKDDVNGDYKRYNHYIVDIDGTIANHHGVRDVYDGSKVINDKLITNIANIVKSLASSNYIWFVSGRDGKYVSQTIDWLNKHFDFEFNNNYAGLIMRGVGDNRDDTIVKQEIYDEYFSRNNYKVIATFDDRDRVVDMWRRNGVTCLQVNYGNF